MTFSRNVFCGATSPRLDGILKATDAGVVANVNGAAAAAASLASFLGTRRCRAAGRIQAADLQRLRSRPSENGRRMKYDRVSGHLSCISTLVNQYSQYTC